MSSALSVADTARRLGVSRRQVQRLVSAGTLRAERGVGGALVVDPASVPAVRPGRGRPWSPAMAWGALWELSGLPAEGLTPAQRRRLPGLLAAAEPDRLVAAVRQRATGESFTASPRALASLAPEVALTGASAGRRRGRRAPERLEAYVTPGRLARLVAHHPIARQAGGNVTLHVADFAPLEQRAEVPAAVVAVDLAGSGDPDERADGLVRLDDLLRAYRVQRARAGSRGGPAADVTRTWMTAVDVAGAVGEELRRGDDDFAFRMVARGLADLRARRRPADVARFLAPPPSTGDRRWDVLLAAVVRRECRRRGLPAPGWTAVEPLRPWWFPLLASPALAARTMQRTPVDFSLLGIWLDGNALETR